MPVSNQCNQWQFLCHPSLHLYVSLLSHLSYIQLRCNFTITPCVENLKQALTEALWGGCVCDKLFFFLQISRQSCILKAQVTSLLFRCRLNASVYCLLANSFPKMKGLIGKRCLQSGLWVGRGCNHINKLSMSSFSIVKLQMRVTNCVNTLVLEEHLKSVTHRASVQLCRDCSCSSNDLVTALYSEVVIIPVSSHIHIWSLRILTYSGRSHLPWSLCVYVCVCVGEHTIIISSVFVLKGYFCKPFSSFTFLLTCAKCWLWKQPQIFGMTSSTQGIWDMLAVYSNPCSVFHPTVIVMTAALWFVT